MAFRGGVADFDPKTDTPSEASERPTNVWQWLIELADAGGRTRMTALAVVTLPVLGVIDYLTGFETSFLVFYLLPVCVATIALGRGGGWLAALCSVLIWLLGDYAAGARYGNTWVPFWNALIALGVYLVVVELVNTLLAARRELETRVRQRTAALADEIAERERLEKVVLEISERERRSIGHELHDALGQHLTGTAVIGQVLAEKLQERGAAEAPEARKLVGLIKTGIDQTRQMAKGLLLADIDAEGLTIALREFCASTAAQSRIECLFEGEDHVALAENGVASHLFRIAQEAVRNAVRHGRARRVVVHLGIVDHRLRLRVVDDGVGLPPSPERGTGLGLRIMEHRALIVGASFAVERRPEGGTVVVCELPLPPE